MLLRKCQKADGEGVGRVVMWVYSQWFDLPLYSFVPFITERLMLETDFDVMITQLPYGYGYGCPKIRMFGLPAMAGNMWG